MDPDDAATVLCCPLCRGPVRARPKPWRFACDDCALTWRPDDIGSLQRSIMRRVLAGPGAAGQPMG